MKYKNYQIERVKHIWEGTIFYDYMIYAYSAEFGCNLVYGYADTLKEAKKRIDTNNFEEY